MHRGKIREVGTPHELIERKGIFSDMVDNTGKNAEKIREVAKKTYMNIMKARKRMEKE